ncbi:MAG: flippase-like domain-containing protein [Methanosarcinaceae archaeon]|nr:flippase-like domain-containing protein [Methanosarcinaceae archaeon]
MNTFGKWLTLSLMISVFSIVVVLALTIDPTTIEAILHVRYEYIFAAAALHVFSYVIWGMRTKTMCKSLGYELDSLRSVEIVISSTLAAAVTPSSAGGEPLRIHLLHQNRIPIGRATAVVIVERLLDAILLLTAAPFALYIFRDILSDYQFDAVFIVSDVFVILVLVLFLYGMWKPEHTRIVMHAVVGRIARILGNKTDAALSNVLHRVDSELEHFHNSVWLFFTEGRRGLLYGVVYTLLYWIVEYTMLPMILIGLNQNPPLVIVFSAQVLLSIFMVIPATPGASGVAEFGATPLFSVFVTSSLLGITIVAWRALTFYMNIIVGSFVSARILKDTELMKKLIG